MYYLYFFFFFQAEDGIRDLYVTGVQTCALPICVPARRPSARRRSPARGAAARDRRGAERTLQRRAGRHGRGRSEERRVGKSVDLGGRRIIKKKNRDEK